MRWKVLDPFLLLKNPRAANQPKRVFDDLDIRVRVKGGGKVSQVYAVRQAIARGVVAYYQKFVTEEAKMTIKDLFLKYDRSLLVSDPRRTESKKIRWSRCSCSLPKVVPIETVDYGVCSFRIRW